MLAAQRDRRLNSGGTFHPGVVLHVMPKLLNTAVVLLSDRGVHASDHIVEGYCMLHRLFVALLHRYPILQQIVAERVRRFVSAESERGKDKVRAMGNSFPSWQCAMRSWAKAIFPVVKECFVRNVIWACEISGTCRTAEPSTDGASKSDSGDSECESDGVDTRRLELTLEATRVGRRLLMFHSLFVRHLARPNGRSVEDSAHALDHSFGLPLEWQKRELRNAVRNILDDKRDSWPAYFASVGVACPSRKGLSLVLRNAITDSARRGYHKSGMDFSRIHRSGVSRILLKGRVTPLRLICRTCACRSLALGAGAHALPGCLCAAVRLRR